MPLGGMIGGLSSGFLADRFGRYLTVLDESKNFVAVFNLNLILENGH